MSQYRSCVNWLKWYDEQIELLEHKMKGKVSSSVIGMSGEYNDPNSVSKWRSLVNDEIKDFVKKNESKWRHCHNTKTLCDIKFKEVKEEYYDTFIKVFVEGSKPIEIENKAVNYTISRIYQIIDEETERLTRL